MDFKAIWEKWTSISLILRIIAGLLVGIALGLLIPGLPYIDLLGVAFVQSLKSVAPILIMAIIITSLITRSTGLGSRFKSVIVLYFLSSVIAAAVSVVVFYIMPVALPVISEEPVGAVTTFEAFLDSIIRKILVNPIDALANTNYLGILFWAVLIGILMKPIATKHTADLSQNITDMLLKVISIFIQFAPFGVLGLIYEALSNNGPELFVDYGALILIIVLSMVLVMFVTNPLIVAVAGKRNPYPLLLTCLRGSAITAFFTRSSAANVPINLALCEEMKLDRDFYSTSIPLGSAINMCGAAITISILALTAAYSIGIAVPIEQAIVLCIIATLCACGSSGVAGGSILLVPMACAILGVPDDVAAYMVGVGFIIGVIQDSLETALNSSSDVLFTATVDANNKKKAAKAEETATE
ncbi:serine/threonine transporter SstT [Methanomassiliicoccales archaeon LGM-RCC1]|nr:serine/threonine transporter SstT [Methanomassiliicoccales archaeon LGM-RCC1]